MGCLSCARGKFLKAHPFSYPLWARPGDSIFSKDLGLKNSLKMLSWVIMVNLPNLRSEKTAFPFLLDFESLEYSECLIV